MENFKAILTAQKEAIEKDIEVMIEEIQDKEILLDAKKRAKSLAFKELRSIEKRLAKLKV